MARRIATVILVFGFVLTGCSSGTGQGIPVITASSLPTGALTPFHTPTPEMATATPTLKAEIPVTPSPTATPFLHTLTDDDTLLGIAFQYGISLEDLQAANPGVDSHYLTVGNQIVIPIGGEITQTLATPTPIPIAVSGLQCHRAGDGGAWCIAAVHNDTPTSLENLSAGIAIYSGRGELIANQVAYAPLNILKPGQTMPLMAYFAPPLPDAFQAQSQLLSGLLVASGDARYLDLQPDFSPITISPDGRQAMVSGNFVLPEGTQTLSELWVLAVAYDSNGAIIGARTWKSTGETQFEITVYSLAGTIDHVDVLTEARP